MGDIIESAWFDVEEMHGEEAREEREHEELFRLLGKYGCPHCGFRGDKSPSERRLNN